MIANSYEDSGVELLYKLYTHLNMHETFFNSCTIIIHTEVINALNNIVACVDSEHFILISIKLTGISIFLLDTRT